MPPHRIPKTRETLTRVGSDVWAAFGGLTEAEHYERCVCGSWIDIRDLNALLTHCRRLPHPSDGRPH